MRDNNHHADPAGLAAAEPAAVVPAAGLSPPRKDEPTEALAGTGGFRDQGKADTLDSEATPAGEQHGSVDAKHVATLRARQALAGWASLRNESGGAHSFLATRWGHARGLHDLAAVEAFARQVGAPC
jgi:hypothetical protein